MLWIPFALFSAIVLASRRVYEKNLTKSFDSFTMGFIVQAFSLLPTLLLFFFLPIPKNFNLPWQFWWPLLIIWFIIYPIQTYFIHRALRDGELSHVMPIMALLPVFNTISSFLIIGESPTIFGFVGISTIVCGTYILLTYGIKKETGEKYNKAVLYMIIATLCVAIGSTLDKVSISVSTPVFYSFMNTFGASIIFLILAYVYKQNNELGKVKNMILPLSLLGIFQALSYTSSMLAFSYGPTSYVLAIRSSSFIFAMLFAVVLVKEKLSFRKVLSFVLCLIGIIFITVTK